jgi:hypothetical protein
MATRRRWVGIYRVTEGQVENLAWSGVGPPAYPSFSVESGVTAAAIREARTVVSNDVAADARHLTNQETTGAELIVPVSRQGRVVGTLDVEDGTSNSFAAGARAPAPWTAATSGTHRQECPNRRGIPGDPPPSELNCASAEPRTGCKYALPMLKVRGESLDRTQEVAGSSRTRAGVTSKDRRPQAGNLTPLPEGAAVPHRAIGYRRRSGYPTAAQKIANTELLPRLCRDQEPTVYQGFRPS